MTIEYYQEQLQAKEDMLARTTHYLLEMQRSLSEKNDLISEANNTLMDSIGFAKIIQTALLPEINSLKKYVSQATYVVNNHIGIGGDSVLIKETGEILSFGLFDATGHGVPAALLSISAMMILNELLGRKNHDSPDKTVRQLSSRLHSTFNTNSSIAHLEGVLCQYFPDDHELVYCSAKGKGLLIHPDGQLTEMPSSGCPIGEQQECRYEVFRVYCRPGDRILLYSDGLTDQFGGQYDKKFSKRRLRDLVGLNAALSADDLGELIVKTHTAWKGDQEQTDDISFLLIEF